MPYTTEWLLQPHIALTRYTGKVELTDLAGSRCDIDALMDTIADGL